MCDAARFRRDAARRWLEAVRAKRRAVALLQAETDAMRDALDGLRAARHDLPSYGCGDAQAAHAHAVDALLDAVRRYCLEACEMADAVEDARARLASLGNPLHTEVLKRYYLLGESMEDVRRAMCYSVDGLNTLKRRALEEAYFAMPEEWA